MMTKSKARAPGRLMRHLARADTNEAVQVGASRCVTPSLAEAMDELALRSATVGAKKSWFHAIGNPEPGQAMSEEGWAAYWQAFEDEFELGTQAFIEVRHRKHGRDHRHRVYSLVRDDGRLVPVSHNYRRNELVSRLGEVATGHPLHPGKHHRWVVGELARRGVELPTATRAERSTPIFSQDEHQQAERKLGTDPRAFKARVYDLYVQSGGDWRAFAARLDRDRITVARGDSALLVVDERSRLHLPLARLLREEAKRAGTPIKIKSADLEAVFGRARPLAEEQEAIDRRRIDQPAAQPAVQTASDKNRMPADLFAARLQAAVAQVLLREQRRAERLKCNRARKAALRRGDLDARIEALLDQTLVAVAAEIIRYVRPRHGLRMAVLVIGALALAGGVGPMLLAAAAVTLLRRGEIARARAQMRVDVDEARAARTGWTFAAVPAADRARYAALSRSGLIDPAGPDAGPLIAALGREHAARFAAWWAYASPKQRLVVQGWGKPPRKRPPQARPRPARQRTRRGMER